MKKILRQAKMVGYLFGKGIFKQAQENDTLALASMVGLSQGLKYTGSLVRGLKAGIVTVLVIGAVNGGRTIYANRVAIKNA